MSLFGNLLRSVIVSILDIGLRRVDIYMDRKDWVKANRLCKTSLQKECDLLRDYRRSQGNSKETLKFEWLKAQKQHNRNIQEYWDSLLAPWLRTQAEKDYEYKHKCPLCERFFYSRHGGTVYCGYWCAYTINKRKRVDKYLKSLKKQCPVCMRIFTASRKGMNFCSNACRQKNYRCKK
uniref:Uncharacterized protein n=1 Tax=Candidatus Kentrum sp. SD TaxID=2126332 RepID=A0A451BSC6_9GAMM|nr:MAG: hypothetical protein BECKSD772F_GA0070984_11524 [Candidatus Kentron sp. SD]VFK48922.1 MAG: hypothetical protein BECKSD772E_GA0070983_11505 [Candidatus Kentron sp. SD]VFK81192.1 MAG: hypothetical protein BECKSD772D_GA0070982_12484 [Candidatus Kentron sp. SD]